MKLCPACQRRYEDETMRFCLEDGTLLVDQSAPAPGGPAGETTLHLPPDVVARPPGRSTRPAQPSAITASDVRPIPAPSPAAQREPYPGKTRRTGAVLWVLGASIIAIASIAVAFIVTRTREQNGNVSDQTSAVASPTVNVEVAAATPGVAQNVNRSGSPAAMTQPSKQKELSTPPKAQPTENPKPEQQEKPGPSPAPLEKTAPRAPVAGGVLNGKAVQLVKPQYPPIARASHISGTVTVQVLIDEEGNVISAHASSGHPLLQASAVAAARASKFTPTKLSGQPVKVSGVIVYNFVEQ